MRLKLRNSNWIRLTRAFCLFSLFVAVTLLFEKCWINMAWSIGFSKSASNICPKNMRWKLGMLLGNTKISAQPNIKATRSKNHESPSLRTSNATVPAESIKIRITLLNAPLLVRRQCRRTRPKRVGTSLLMPFAIIESQPPSKKFLGGELPRKGLSGVRGGCWVHWGLAPEERVPKVGSRPPPQLADPGPSPQTQPSEARSFLGA